MRRSRFTRRMILALARKDPAQAARLIASMTIADLLDLDTSFEAWAHAGQVEPRSTGWRTWLMLAGRGYGKTRAGAEWIARLVCSQPCRVALVGATIDEARAVMVEGESGLLSVLERGRRRSVWEPSMKRLRFGNGSVVQLYSGENPDGLRGGTHHFAWCDELAKWARPEESWDNLQMSLRAGMRPRALVTTTPRPIPLLRRIEAEPWTITTRGRTRDNLVLEEQFLAVMQATYGGTRLGRQELDGELIADIEGALWTRTLIDCARNGRDDEELRRVVVAVDPPASADGDACGIVVAGLGRDGCGYVLEDASMGGLSPIGWAGRVSQVARRWGADRVIAEVNNGGEMVTTVLGQVDAGLPVKAVHASRGKSARAEPVAALYEQGRVRHLGAFPELEDQLCGMTIAGGYEGPGRSPDRADALVWALTELMLGVQREARVRWV